MSAALACALLVLAAKPLPLRPHFAPERTAERGRGRVTEVTAQGGYLDLGAADGLKPGDKLKVFRKGGAAATCTVEAVADTRALCVGKGLREGDPVRVVLPPVPELEALPPPLTPEELELRRQRLEGAPLALVDFTPTAGAKRTRRVLLEASYRHTSWSTGGALALGFHLEQLDVAVRGLELGRGLKVFVDLGVRLWSGRPAGARDPVTSVVQLQVREAALTFSGPERSYWLGAGRLWVEGAPGLAMLDGIQGGWKWKSGLEVGSFAGLLPEPFASGLATHRWTFGLYQSFEWRGEGAVRLVRQQARAGLLGVPALRGEVELATQLWFAHHLDLDAGVRVGFGRPAPVVLDAARLYAGFRPVRPVLLRAGGRLVGQQPEDLSTLISPMAGVPGLHVDGSASWEVFSAVVVSGQVGFTRDFDAQLSRFWAGPELAFPRLWFGLGGVSVSWAEETGHWGRRAVSLSTDLRPIPQLRFSARFTFTQDTPSQGTGEFSTSELGAFAAADATLPLGFSVRASVLVRHGLGRKVLGGEAALREVASTAWVSNASVSWAW